MPYYVVKAKGGADKMMKWRCQNRSVRGKCNYALALGIGMLMGTLLPCKVTLVICALLICIVSLSAFRK